MRSGLALITLACLLAGSPGPAMAQSTRFSGLSVVRFHHERSRFHTLAYRRTYLGSRDGGGDLAIGFLPSAAAAGAILSQLDFGVARAVPVGPAKLLLRAGSSNFVAIARTLEVYPGAQLGAGALIRVERFNWVRLDLTRHFYVSGDESLNMWSIGIGFAVESPP